MRPESVANVAQESHRHHISKLVTIVLVAMMKCA